MIEGIPEGWELVRVGKPLEGEFFIDGLDEIRQAHDDNHFHGCAIIRKIEKPKTYRAFANKAEYAPHRDRWVVCKDQAGNGDFSSCLPTSFDDDGVVIGGDFEEYGEAFRGFGFDNFDGTTEPFGVEVQS